MGNFSRDTYDQLNHYVSVRLQQGVPIVDADWNEKDDIRRYELRAFLRWFVGNGVPLGNDGFSITDAGSDNDFAIGEGRCLVEGWDVINEAALGYTAQALFRNADLAAEWDVDVLPALAPPAGSDRTDTVYLDVWEREVDSTEDDNLVNPDIGIETCVRTRREWVVRVAVGGTLPAVPDGHEFYELATLNRADGVAAIDDIEDLRRTGLQVLSYHNIEQIVTDAFGTGYTLDGDGQANLKVSLRDAINAVLRGGLPSTPEVVLSPDDAVDLVKAVHQDSNGDIWMFYVSDRDSGNIFGMDLWYNRYRAATGEWEGDTQLSSGGDIFYIFNVDVLEDNAGRLWVFWSGGNEINYDRYDLAAESWLGNTPLTADPSGDYWPSALQHNSGEIWCFWYSDRDGDYNIYYNRYDPGTDSWAGDTALTTDAGDDEVPMAFQHSSAEIWCFWSSDRDGDYNIYYNRYDPGTDSWAGDTALTTDAGDDEIPVALEDDNNDVWVFWISDRNVNQQIYYNRYDIALDSWEGDVQLTTQPEEVEFFAPGSTLKDDAGDLWVFWYTEESGVYRVWYKRKSRDGGWGPAVQLSSGDTEVFPFVLQDQIGDLWVFWTRGTVLGEDLDYDVVYKTLIPSI